MKIRVGYILALVVGYVFLAIVFLFTPYVAEAKPCTFTWVKSVSNGVQDYTLYRNGQVVTTGINGTLYTMPCIEGKYQFTATNKQGVESIKSKAVFWEYVKPPTRKIKAPKTATNIKVK